MRRILVAVAFVAFGSLVSVASPSQAASGPWSTVSVGGSHTCAINTGKSLYCWGRNLDGQIGDGTSVNLRPSPKKIGSTGVWATVSSGSDHTCAISTGKALYCWGRNYDGQIGDGTSDTDRFSPKRIGARSLWASVAAGEHHTCAISTSAVLYCWGNNITGQIGDGTTTDRLSPTLVSPRSGRLAKWSTVTVGSQHSCAITTGSSLYCWGWGDNGQIGNGTTNTTQKLPVRIGATGVWARVSAGVRHNCAVSTAKSLYCWGWNEFGQVGDGTSGTDRLAPKKIGSSGVWTTANTGGSTNCAISTGKSLYCWGYNAHGEIGDGSTTQRNSPKIIGRPGAWAAADSGGGSCAITGTKSLYCWGDNDFGQVGDGTFTDRLFPRMIA